MAVVSSHILQLFWFLVVVLFKRVEPFWFHPVAGDLVENFHFIESGDEVMAGRSLNFQRNIRVILDIFGQPYGRKVTPSQLLDDQVSVNQDLTIAKKIKVSLSKIKSPSSKVLTRHAWDDILQTCSQAFLRPQKNPCPHNYHTQALQVKLQIRDKLD